MEVGISPDPDDHDRRLYEYHPQLLAQVEERLEDQYGDLVLERMRE